MAKKVSNFVEHSLKHAEDKFNAEAKNFQRMMEVGGGVENLHMYNCINSLMWLYQRIAALREAKGVLADALIPKE